MRVWERDYRLYNINNCVDCMMDVEAGLVITLAVVVSEGEDWRMSLLLRKSRR